MASNDTFIPTYSSCDELSDLCPVEATIYGAKLSSSAAYFFGIAFAVCLLIQIYFGCRARTWSYLVWLGLGTAFEVAGYWARTRLAVNPWSFSAFAINFLTILLAPTLVAAAISVTFKSLVIWYGQQWSLLRPSLYPWVFVGTDFFSIFIQVIGGGATAASAAGEGNETIASLGEKLVIGGVVFQVVNMLVCGSLMLIYTARRKKAVKNGPTLLENHAPEPEVLNADGTRLGIATSRATATEKEAKRVRIFVYCLVAAYMAIIIRCAYRITEQIPSISFKVLRNEPLFLGLDGAMILLSIGLVSFVHPYKFFPILGASKEQKIYQQSGGFQMMPTQQENAGFMPPQVYRQQQYKQQEYPADGR
ncbi:hypothetical protein BN1708_011564 [Verticillium longisporum]|uniref:RTA1 domain protein n=1 Tax=Verticillium longisporum TaxID=100787 RepID=A0A0G4L1H5_VERLO|nr:Efflux pump himE like protein [Verticillium longisporum]CRK15821.1 hypothetical protein BN1708_011564 [Verticillium longisporum]